MLREQTFTRRKNTDLNRSLLQIQHATFLTQQRSGLPCFAKSSSPLQLILQWILKNTSSRRYIPSSGGWGSCTWLSVWLLCLQRWKAILLILHTTQLYLWCIVTQVRKALTFPGSVVSTDWYAEATCLLEKGGWDSLLSCHRAVLHLCKCYFFPAAHC